MNRAAGPTTLRQETRHPAAVRIAQSPPEHRGLRRDQVRLLVVEPAALVHRRFHELPQHLRPGDLLVVNNSATLPAELDGTSPAHGALVVHVGTRLRRLDSAPPRRVVELRTAPDAARPVLDCREGEEIQVPGGVRFRLIAPYPRPGASPTGAAIGCGRPTFSAPIRRRTISRCMDAPSRTATSPSASRSPTTRRSSPSAPEAPRCPARPDRSPPSWSPTWSPRGSASHR